MYLLFTVVSTLLYTCFKKFSIDHGSFKNVSYCYEACLTVRKWVATPVEILDNQSNPKKGHIKKSLFLSIQSFYNQASN